MQDQSSTNLLLRSPRWYPDTQMVFTRDRRVDLPEDVSPLTGPLW